MSDQSQLEIPESQPSESTESQEEQLQIKPQRIMVRLPRGPVVATYVIIAITVIVYLLQMFGGSLLFPDLSCPYFQTSDIAACYGLKVNELILSGQLWRLIAPILLHGSLLHIAFNMYALNALGPDLERHFGLPSFLALYLVSGFAGFVLSFLMTASPSLGASTAIFGLLGAQGVFVYRNQRVFGPRARAALTGIINIAVINFIIGLSPGIDNWGHFGGLLGGALFAWLAAPVYEIGGEAPEYDLVNTRAEGLTPLVFVGVFFLFALLAATRFF